MDADRVDESTEVHLRLDNLLEHLALAGYSIGVREVLLCHQVSTKALKGENGLRVELIANYIAPIVSKTPEQFINFNNTVNEFIRLSASKAGPPPPPPPPRRLLLLVTLLTAAILVSAVFDAPNRRVFGNSPSPSITTLQSPSPSSSTSPRPLTPTVSPTGSPVESSTPTPSKSPSVPVPTPIPSVTDAGPTDAILPTSPYDAPWKWLTAYLVAVGGFWYAFREPRESQSVASGSVPQKVHQALHYIAMEIPAKPKSFRAQTMLRLSQRIRAQRKKGQEYLDVHKSARLTAARLGYPSEVIGFRKATKERLILIERLSLHDHLARLCQHFFLQLINEQAPLKIAFFRESTEWLHWKDCWRRGPEVFAEASPDELWLVTSTAGLMNRYSDNLAPWVESLRDRCEIKIVLLDMPERHLLMSLEALGYTVAGFEREGLEALASGHRPPVPKLHALPPNLSSGHEESETRDSETLHSLKSYLSKEAFDLLLRCSIYPELRFDLTSQINNSGQADITDASQLTALYSLTWFRNGLIPSRLRARLASELGPHLKSETLQTVALATSLALSTSIETPNSSSTPVPMTFVPSKLRRTVYFRDLLSGIESAPRIVQVHVFFTLFVALLLGTSSALVAAQLPLLGRLLAITFGIQSGSSQDQKETKLKTQFSVLAAEVCLFSLPFGYRSSFLETLAITLVATLATISIKRRANLRLSGLRIDTALASYLNQSVGRLPSSIWTVPIWLMAFDQLASSVTSSFVFAATAAMLYNARFLWLGATRKESAWRLLFFDAVGVNLWCVFTILVQLFPIQAHGRLAVFVPNWSQSSLTNEVLIALGLFPLAGLLYLLATRIKHTPALLVQFDRICPERIFDRSLPAIPRLVLAVIYSGAAGNWSLACSLYIVLTAFILGNPRLMVGSISAAIVWISFPQAPTMPSPVSDLDWHQTSVTATSVSSGGRLLATAGEGGSVRIWDLAQADPSINSWEIPGSVSVASVKFLSDSRHLIIGRIDGTLEAWNLETVYFNGHLLPHITWARPLTRILAPQMTGKWESKGTPLLSLSTASLNGVDRLLSISKYEVQLWNCTRSGGLDWVKQLKVPAVSQGELLISEKGQLQAELVVSDGVLSGGVPEGPFVVRERGRFSALSVTDKRVAAATFFGQIYFKDVPPRFQLSGAVKHLALSNLPKLSVVAGLDNGEVDWLQPTKPAHRLTIGRHSGPVTAVTTSGELVASGDKSGDIFLYYLAGQKKQAKLPAKASAMTTLQFANIDDISYGQSWCWLVATSDDGTVRLYNPKAYQLNAKTIDEPFTLEASVGKGGKNLTTDVVALKTRLVKLGYLLPDESPTVTDQLVTAIRLIQSIEAGSQVLVGDGLLEPTGDTYRFIRGESCPHWQEFPESAPGHINHSKSLKRNSPNDFVTDWLVDTILSAAKDYESSYRLKQTVPSAKMVTNGGSLFSGGPQAEYIGKETGLSIDLLLPKKDGSYGGIRWTSPEYDRNATQAMLESLRRNRRAPTRVFFSDATLIKAGLCLPSAQTGNRINVQISSPLDQRLIRAIKVTSTTPKDIDPDQVKQAVDPLIWEVYGAGVRRSQAVYAMDTRIGILLRQLETSSRKIEFTQNFDEASGVLEINVTVKLITPPPSVTQTVQKGYWVYLGVADIWGQIVRDKQQIDADSVPSAGQPVLATSELLFRDGPKPETKARLRFPKGQTFSCLTTKLLPMATGEAVWGLVSYDTFQDLMLAEATKQLKSDSETVRKAISNYTGLTPGPKQDLCIPFLSFIYHQVSGRDPGWGRQEGWMGDVVTWSKSSKSWTPFYDPVQQKVYQNTPGPVPVIPGDLVVFADLKYDPVTNPRDVYVYIGLVESIDWDKLKVTVIKPNPMGDGVLTRSTWDLAKKPDQTNPGVTFIAGFVHLTPP